MKRKDDVLAGAEGLLAVGLVHSDCGMLGG